LEGCFCCKIAQGKGCGYQAREYVVELDGGWILNHYGERGNSYLGYLVLATKRHVEDIGGLSPEEAQALGTNIMSINSGLRRYWLDNFDDLIEQIHVAYLNEGPFIDHNLDGLHVHFHILPRTRRMIPDYDANKIGWRLLDHVREFPEYLRSSDYAKEALMRYLGKSIGIRSS
jgi:diadenosine tetraphosphate (Ap4A) HIT family hydrolase